MNKTALKFAPVENGEKRIEMSLDGDETVIKMSSWVEGLGWCGQKTMAVDADLLDELHSMLGAARVRMRRQHAENGQPAAIRKVLAFPSSK